MKVCMVGALKKAAKRIFYVFISFLVLSYSFSCNMYLGDWLLLGNLFLEVFKFFKAFRLDSARCRICTSWPVCIDWTILIRCITILSLPLSRIMWGFVPCIRSPERTSHKTNITPLYTLRSNPQPPSSNSFLSGIASCIQRRCSYIVMLSELT